MVKIIARKLCNSYLAIMVMLGLAASQVNAQNSPFNYYTFENTATPMKDDMGNGNLDPNYYGGTYTIQSNGKVGKAMEVGSTTNYVLCAQTPLTNQFTFEFIFKASSEFQGCNIFGRWDGAVSARIGYPYISFNTKSSKNGTSADDQFLIDLNGIGRKQYGYYLDGNWHHLVFKVNLTTGVKEVWVDGQLPVGFSKTMAVAGSLFSSAGSPNNIMFLNTNSSYLKIKAQIDEIAIYKLALPNNVIYKHYNEVQAGSHYTFTNSTVAPPPPSPVTAGIDIKEYAPGHPNYTVSATEQIVSMPVPRFKPGHTLLKNTSLIDYVYLGGRYQPGVSDNEARDNSVAIQRELATNFNHNVIVAGNTGSYTQFNNTTTFNGAWIKLANDNPQFGAAALSYWPHLNPTNAGYAWGSAYVNCGCLGNNNYLQNANGQFLDLWGNVTTQQKYMSPIAPDLTNLGNDGMTQKFYLQKLLDNMTRPLNHIFENGEQIPYYLPQFQGPSKDPNVVNAKNASGLDWYTWLSKRYTVYAKNYRDKFMNMPALSNTRFTYYQIDGHDTYRQKYSEVRTISTQINGTNYASGDLYIRYPWNWRTQFSAWNGLQWLIESRYEELKNGDKYFSPAVGAGWDDNEENNIRPAQWLGLMKVMSMMGAEFFYPSYFVMGQPWPKPEGYLWQSAIPSYAQAITSRYEDLFRNGVLLDGDMKANEANVNSGPAYMFRTGDDRKVIVIRKHNSLNKYAITGTLQNNSNQKGNAEIEGVATFKLNGQTMKVNVRRQGSTYVFDNTNTANPVFYQLDKWHEETHPSYWNSDFNFEAELFDNTNTSLAIKTERPLNAAAGDFTNFTSYLTFSAAAKTANYDFVSRGTVNKKYYVWIKARAKGGVSTGVSVKLDGLSAQNIDCINKTAWTWYRVATNGLPTQFANVTPGTHTLTFTSINANIEIDQIFITTNSAALYGAGTTACNGNVIAANITANGATTFCSGKSVVLTANTAATYLWSNGATTKSITVNTGGSYIVTITDGQGGAGTSAPTDVTVLPAPIATVTANGPLTFCNGASVKLTAAPNSSYLWLPDNKTYQTFTTAAAGSFTVVVTGTNGCTKQSAYQNVVVNNCTPTCEVPFGLAVLVKTNSFARLTWDRSLRSANYQIEIKDLVTGTVNTYTIGPWHSIKVSNLISNRMYNWRVKSICNNISSAFSAWAAFKTNAAKGGIDSDDEGVSVLFDENAMSQSNSLIAYPNPVADNVSLAFLSEVNEERSLMIYDATGKLVWSQSLSIIEGVNNLLVDVSEFTNGLYLVQIPSSQGTLTTRIIKK